MKIPQAFDKILIYYFKVVKNLDQFHIFKSVNKTEEFQIANQLPSFVKPAAVVL